MSRTTKIIATIITVLLAGFLFLLGVSIAISPHNIPDVQRSGANFMAELSVITGPLLIIEIWLPWKKILKKG